MTDYNENLSALMDGDSSSSEDRFFLKRLLESGQQEALRDTWSRYHLIGDVMRDDAKLNLDGFADGVMAKIALDDQQEQNVDISNANSGKRSAKLGWLWPTISGASIAACAVLATVLVIGSPSQEIVAGSGLASSDQAKPLTPTTTVAASAVASSAAVMVPVSDSIGSEMGPYRNYPNANVHQVGFGNMPSASRRWPTTIPVPMFAEPARIRYTRVPSTQWESAGKALQERLNSYLINHSEHAASSMRQGPVHYGRLVGYDMSNQ